MHFVIINFFLALTVVPVLAAPATHCRVADPTGTPLNVRAVPNGTVVGTLNNDTVVTVLSQTTAEGKAWAYIGTGKEELPAGWVFKGYLTCAPPG
jgi:hypothetical protein